MNFIYNDFEIHTLGDVTVSSKREYEGGSEATGPQRVKVTLELKVEFFQESFADNYSLVRQLREALQVQHGLLEWTNPETNESYVNQPAQVLANDLPEDPNAWGTFYQQCNVTFLYYEHNVAANNIPLLVTRSGATNKLTLTAVQRWSETVSTERFSPLHSQRKLVTVELSASGMILADTTKSLDAQRAELAAAKDSLDELDGVDCVMQFGAFFTGTVRVGKFTVDVDQAAGLLRWSFTASYTRLPDDTKDFSIAEFQAEQREALQPATGEQFLELTGKITANNEAVARARLDVLTSAIVTQYSYGSAQQLRSDTSAVSTSPASDDDLFLELTFSLSWRRFRADNTNATFVKLPNLSPKQKPTVLGNIRGWMVEYSARRFNEHRSQRQHAGGRIEASGTIMGDPALAVPDRKSALMAQADSLMAVMNSADGVLTRGAFTQTVRVENFKAEVNQALTGIDWAMTASWTQFPNEAGYATVEFSIAQRESVEDGESYLNFAGRLWAQDEAAARAKLESVRTAMLGTYGFTAAQRIRDESVASNVFANGDKTTALADVEADDGTTFLELTWSEEYRKRTAGLVNWSLRTTSRDDVPSGLRSTVYAGYVMASGATADAAYAAALAQAQSLGANKETQVGGNAFLRMSTIAQDTRQTQASNTVEFVRLEFSYEYQSKIGPGQAIIEMTMELVTDPFGADMENVQGYIVAADFNTAEDIYNSIRALYSGRLVRGERTSETQLQSQSGTSFKAQELRLDFAFNVYRPKDAGKISYRYGIAVQKDFLNLQKSVRVHGSVFATTSAAAGAAVDALLAVVATGVQLQSQRSEDDEYTSDSAGGSATGLFIKLDFDESYVDRLTGISELLEMDVTEDVTHSGENWVLQPTLKKSDGSGGISMPQSVSIKPGQRVVRGSVTAASKDTCMTWAKKQRALLTGDKDGKHVVQPEQYTTNYQFVPRIEGVITGTAPNVRVYRLDFVYQELLPNYPAPQ